MYVGVINNIESWRFNESKDNITIDVQVCYWCPKYKIEGGFDVMYMNRPANKHDEWAEENQRKREAYNNFG